MKAILAIAFSALLCGCTTSPRCHKTQPPEVAISDGILGATSHGELIIDDAAYARYTALLARYSERFIPTLRQQDETPEGAIKSASGSMWTLSREAIELLGAMQRWEHDRSPAP